MASTEQAYPSSGAPALGRTLFGGAVGSGSGVVASSFQYLLTGTEQLRVTAYNTDVDLTVSLVARVYRGDQPSIQTHAYELRALAGFTSTKDFPLSAGALLNVRVSTPGSGTLTLAQLFVQVQIISGSGSGAVVVGTILQGYCDAFNELGWPGTPLADMHSGRGHVQTRGFNNNTGPLRAEMTVPANRRLIPLCGSCTFTASGVVGNRFALVLVTNFGGSVPVFQSAFDTAITAGQSTILSIGLGTPLNPSPVTRIVTLPFPNDLEMIAGQNLRIYITGEQAGDAMTSNGLLVREWFDY